MSVKKNDVMKR